MTLKIAERAEVAPFIVMDVVRAANEREAAAAVQQGPLAYPTRISSWKATRRQRTTTALLPSRAAPAARVESYGRRDTG